MKRGTKSLNKYERTKGKFETLRFNHRRPKFYNYLKYIKTELRLKTY